MDILAVFTIFLSLGVFMAVLVPVMLEDSPVALLVTALVPVVVAYWVGSLGFVSLFICLLIVCLPFALYSPQKR
tara:strand:- start:163 stop:384 length:222 start_codon:yes stop_codon:yes gene_type:complete